MQWLWVIPLSRTLKNLPFRKYFLRLQSCPDLLHLYIFSLSEAAERTVTNIVKTCFPIHLFIFINWKFDLYDGYQNMTSRKELSEYPSCDDKFHLQKIIIYLKRNRTGCLMWKQNAKMSFSIRNFFKKNISVYLTVSLLYILCPYLLVLSKRDLQYKK